MELQLQTLLVTGAVMNCALPWGISSQTSLKSQKTGKKEIATNSKARFLGAVMQQVAWQFEGYNCYYISSALCDPLCSLSLITGL